MARPQTFARDLKIATAGLEPDAIKGLLVSTALQALSDAQNAREFPSQYITTVNDRVGASIQSVEPPGPIVYTAVWWPEILEYGLAFAEGRSPVLSGRFKRSWFAMANGSPLNDFAAIPLNAECIITNDQPYSRKIEVGHMHMSVPPGVVEDLVSALRRKFGNLISVRRQFISLEGAYALRRGSRRRRRASPGGRMLSYPAAVITMTF
jgi:hypothetical protein